MKVAVFPVPNDSIGICAGAVLKLEATGPSTTRITFTTGAQVVVNETLNNVAAALSD